MSGAQFSCSCLTLVFEIVCSVSTQDRCLLPNVLNARDLVLSLLTIL